MDAPATDEMKTRAATEAAVVDERLVAEQTQGGVDPGGRAQDRRVLAGGREADAGRR
jgi:hypothetical protein